MHENCPVQEEVITYPTYKNEGFRPGNEYVGWVDIGTSSRPIIREVVGRVPRGVKFMPDGTEKILVNTYVRSYKGDYPLSLLGGEISRTTDKFEESELTIFYSREFAATLSYSEFVADPAILFPGKELVIPKPAMQPATFDTFKSTHETLAAQSKS